jgi:hypothetical protein
MAKEEPVNILDEHKQKIGTYVLNRISIDNPTPGVPDYELYVFGNDGERKGMISFLHDGTVFIKNKDGTLGQLRANGVPPTTLVTQAAHVFVLDGDKSPRELAERFIEELSKIQRGEHKEGRKPGGPN